MTFRTSASGRDDRAFGVSGNNGFGRSHGLCRKREGDRPGLPRRPDRQGDDPNAIGAAGDATDRRTALSVFVRVRNVTGV